MRADSCARVPRNVTNQLEEDLPIRASAQVGGRNAMGLQRDGAAQRPGGWARGSPGGRTQCDGAAQGSGEVEIASWMWMVRHVVGVWWPGNGPERDGLPTSGSRVRGQDEG